MTYYLNLILFSFTLGLDGWEYKHNALLKSYNIGYSHALYVLHTKAFSVCAMTELHQRKYGRIQTNEQLASHSWAEGCCFQVYLQEVTNMEMYPVWPCLVPWTFISKFMASILWNQIGKVESCISWCLIRVDVLEKPSRLTFDLEAKDQISPRIILLVFLLLIV